MSTSPLLCDPADKPKLEAANGVDQLDFITYLVTERQIVDLRESHVLDFHRLAVKGIYPCAGKYRDALRRVEIRGSMHKVPHEALVPQLVRDMVDEVNGARRSQPAVERSAYVLWRMNWIHPFAGGNGRTARAASYLILCVDMGMMLPGAPTVPSLIYDRRVDYVNALRTADRSVEDRPRSRAGPRCDDGVARGCGHETTRLCDRSPHQTHFLVRRSGGPFPAFAIYRKRREY